MLGLIVIDSFISDLHLQHFVYFYMRAQNLFYLALFYLAGDIQNSQTINGPFKITSRYCGAKSRASGDGLREK
jgi:hypothetical protein